MASFTFPFHQHLMQSRVRKILLVCSRYDSFVIEEDGGLADQIQVHFLQLNLSNSPHTTRVDNVRAALAKLEKHGQKQQFGMIITIHQYDDHSLFETYHIIHSRFPDIPIFPVYQSHIVSPQEVLYKHRDVIRFLWTGDATLFLCMIKLVEDKLNLDRDVDIGVTVLVYIEDEPHYYSNILPIIFNEIFASSQALQAEDLNTIQRIQKMRSRPKILLATNFEEAAFFLNKYSESLLGVVSDIRIPKNGILTDCGFELKETYARHVPYLFLSSEEDGEERAFHAGASFAHKSYPRKFSKRIHSFVKHYLGYGAFVFRHYPPDVGEIMRANDLNDFVKVIGDVPDDSIMYHAMGNHFAAWFLAHGEFGLANYVRTQNSAWKELSAPGIVQKLRVSIEKYQKAKRKGLITDFENVIAHPEEGYFTRIGGGSLGGKARGLLFLDRLLKESDLASKFPNVVIDTPPTLVLTTDVFETFLEENDLHLFTDPHNMPSVRDEEIMECFLTARIDDKTCWSLRDYLNVVTRPLAIRSSGISEDSRKDSTGGVFHTYVIPNDPESDIRHGEYRFLQLSAAIKLVFASAFLEDARNHMLRVHQSLGVEKMAVVIQEVVGEFYADKTRYYPTVSGVAKSWNFYAMEGTKPEEGVCNLVLGLGRALETGPSIKFSLGTPRASYLSSPTEYIRKTQKTFWAIDLSSNEHLFLSPQAKRNVYAKMTQWRNEYDANRKARSKCDVCPDSSPPDSPKSTSMSPQPQGLPAGVGVGGGENGDLSNVVVGGVGGVLPPTVGGSHSRSRSWDRQSNYYQHPHHSSSSSSINDLLRSKSPLQSIPDNGNLDPESGGGGGGGGGGQLVNFIDPTSGESIPGYLVDSSQFSLMFTSPRGQQLHQAVATTATITTKGETEENDEGSDSDTGPNPAVSNQQGTPATLIWDESRGLEEPFIQFNQQTGGIFGENGNNQESANNRPFSGFINRSPAGSIATHPSHTPTPNNNGTRAFIPISPSKSVEENGFSSAMSSPLPFIITSPPRSRSHTHHHHHHHHFAPVSEDTVLMTDEGSGSSGSSGSGSSSYFLGSHGIQKSAFKHGQFTPYLSEHELKDSEKDRTLFPVGSVFNIETQGITDSIYGKPDKMIRLVTFRKILQQQMFPVAEILSHVIRIGEAGMGGPVEVEFSINLLQKPVEFILLQLRPQTMIGSDFERSIMVDTSSPRNRLIKLYFEFLESDLCYLMTNNDKSEMVRVRAAALLPTALPPHLSDLSSSSSSSSSKVDEEESGDDMSLTSPWSSTSSSTSNSPLQSPRSGGVRVEIEGLSLRETQAIAAAAAMSVNGAREMNWPGSVASGVKRTRGTISGGGISSPSPMDPDTKRGRSLTVSVHQSGNPAAAAAAAAATIKRSSNPNTPGLATTRMSRARSGSLGAAPSSMAKSPKLLAVSGHFIPPQFVSSIFCFSNKTLGHCFIDDISHILYVKPDDFDCNSTIKISAQVSDLNDFMLEKNLPYVAVSMGRWGTKSHSLGIPVSLQDVLGARCFVEMSMPNFNIDPSHGSHFLDHVSSASIPYLNIGPQHDDIRALSCMNEAERKRKRRGEWFDWEWLGKQEIVKETKYCRVVKTKLPLVILVNGKKCRGVLLKGMEINKHLLQIQEQQKHVGGPNSPKTPNMSVGGGGGGGVGTPPTTSRNFTSSSYLGGPPDILGSANSSPDSKNAGGGGDVQMVAEDDGYDLIDDLVDGTSMMG